MTAIPWDQVLAAAQAAAPYLPPPANVVATLALAIAKGLVESGCTVDGCDVELLPPRAPDLRGRALADQIELDRIATGTDRRGIDAARDVAAEGQRAIVHRDVEHPDADEVYGLDDGDVVSSR